MSIMLLLAPTDNDLQGSDGSGSLGGPDVRRRIPIKLISKQPLRSKPPPRTQRPGSRPPKLESGEDGKLILRTLGAINVIQSVVTGRMKREYIMAWETSKIKAYMSVCKLTKVSQQNMTLFPHSI